MKLWPALDVAGEDDDLLIAALVDFQLTAIEGREGGVRAYFANVADRDRAAAELEKDHIVSSVEVDDEDWARRSQENLQPVTIGRITVTPPAFPRSDDHTIIIQASMGFGTGHHATTRLCLEALQQIDLGGRTMLDVGTGSGVLAIAARMLGAREALGIDSDLDAIHSAEENLSLNPGIDRVRFEAIDLRERAVAPADVVTANLTGGLLTAAADTLIDLVAPGGTLIVSGLQAHEQDQVFSTFGGLQRRWVREEDGWVGAAFNRTPRREV
jgi:ribosomal protein L11 methyltransferase